VAVGRFQVMATLQAARAYVLGMEIGTAKSWGMNRAIFYAAAKKGFKRVRTTPKRFVVHKRELSEEESRKLSESFQIYNMGDEMAYAVNKDGKLYFTIGNQIQTEKDFEKQIEKRFGNNFKKAWKEAVKLVKGFEKGVLLSQKYFYETVYKPRRDKLAKKWSEI